MPDVRGVGHDPVHYEALTKIFLLNIVLLSLNNDCNMITDGHCYC